MTLPLNSKISGSFKQENSLEVPLNQGNSPVQNSRDVQVGFTNGSIPPEKLDKINTLTFVNKNSYPPTPNIIGDLGLILNELKIVLNNSVGAKLTPVFVPVMQKSFFFMQSNVAASQTDVSMDVLGLVGCTEYTMPFPGSIIGISIASNAARTNGTLTVEAVFIVPPGSTIIKTGLTATLDAVTPLHNYATREAPLINTFIASWRIGVLITTSGAWTPTTADIVVTLITT